MLTPNSNNLNNSNGQKTYRTVGDPTRTRIFNLITDGKVSTAPVRVNGVKGYVDPEVEVSSLITDLQSVKTDINAVLETVDRFMRSRSRTADETVRRLLAQGYEMAPQADPAKKSTGGKRGRPARQV